MIEESTRTSQVRPATAWYRSPVVWIIMAIGVFGIAVLTRDFRRLVATFAGTALLAAAVLVLVGLFGWWVFSRIRPIRPVPRRRALACLGWGMVGATGCAILANAGLGNLWARTAGMEFASTWGDALTAPINEETLKMAGLVLLILAVSGWVRGPMEGFIYGALIGLGFQIAEDWIYAMNGIIGGGAVAPLASATESMAVRVILTGLGSHWTMSAVAGAGVGYLATRRGSGRRTALGIGLFLLAMLMHWLFDSPLLPGLVGSGGKAFINLAIALTVYFLLRHRLRVAAHAELGAADGAELLTRRHRRKALKKLPKDEPRETAARTQLDRLDQVEDRAYAAT